MKGFYVLGVLVLLILSSCDNTKKVTDKATREIEEVLNTNRTVKETGCYLTVNTYEVGNDTLQLNYTVYDTDEVAGKFNWIPAEKDALKGSFEGAKHQNYLKGVYNYIQEGIPGTAPIEIKIVNTKAEVKLIKDEEADLVFTLSETACP